MNNIQTKADSSTQGTYNVPVDNTLLNVGYFYLNGDLKLYPKFNVVPANVHVWGKICSAVCVVAMRIIQKYDVSNITICLLDMKSENVGRIFIEKFKDKHQFDIDKVKFIQWKPSMKIL